MAIMRCKAHEPKRAQRAYVAAVELVGYPETALICGSAKCVAPAFIRLETDEKAAYDRVERVFRSFTATMKARAAP